MSRIVFLSFLLISQFPALAGTSGYQIGDGGSAKNYVVDCDFLVCRPPGGIAHIVSVGYQESGEKMVEKARSLASTGVLEFDLRVFPMDAAGDEKEARWLNRKICARLVPGSDARAIAKTVGASAFELPAYAPGYVVLTFPEIGDSLTKLADVRGQADVIAANPLLAWKKNRRLIPNDAKFAHSASNTNYQWHLDNTGQNGSIVGLDANITGVWDTYLGSGVTISIVDDGLEVTHPDLIANTNTAIDHDWNDGTPDDPTPNNTIDDHGTNCAGVAAGRGNNSIGISGAAPEASLVGLRLIANDTTDQEDAEAIAWRTDVIDISSNSWGPDDSGEDFFKAGALTQAAFVDGVTNGRGGEGTIYVWAGGNGRDDGDYSNYDAYNNRTETISVGAVAFNGRQTWYSESGANLLVCAPSDNDDGDPGITTTTLTTKGSYTDSFGGTSSATPLVSGVLALVLESNPNLGWRDVQEILVRSSRKVDASDTGWSDNGAGFHFNHKYGAGMIDAAAAVALAGTWTNLGARQTQEVGSGAISLGIPDDNAAGVSHTLSLTEAAIRVEHVQLTVDIDHSYRGDLEVFLTSPSGTISQFTQSHNDGGNDIENYTFLTVRNWGEMSTGDWTVRVADRESGDVGTVRSLSLKAFGTSPLSGFELWASLNLDPEQDTSPGGDPDGDRRKNLLEYALDSDPNQPDITNRPTISPTAFEFKADTSKTDITYRVETSTDLMAWAPASTTVASTSGSVETRRFSIPQPVSGRLFLRLVILKN